MSFFIDLRTGYAAPRPRHLYEDDSQQGLCGRTEIRGEVEPLTDDNRRERPLPCRNCLRTIFRRERFARMGGAR